MAGKMTQKWYVKHISHSHFEYIDALNIGQYMLAPYVQYYAVHFAEASMSFV